MDQFRKVEDLNASRNKVTELLQSCAPETKRRLAPVMKYKIMDVFLGSLELQARDLAMGFEELLQEDETSSMLTYFTQRLLSDGEKAASELMTEFDLRLAQVTDQHDAETKRLTGKTSYVDAKALTDA